MSTNTATNTSSETENVESQLFADLDKNTIAAVVSVEHTTKSEVVSDAVKEFFDRLNGPAPSTYDGEEPPDETDPNPLLTAADYALTALEDIGIYASYGRTATCESLVKDAIEIITALRTRHIEQEKMIDVLKGDGDNGEGND